MTKWIVYKAGSSNDWYVTNPGGRFLGAAGWTDDITARVYFRSEAAAKEAAQRLYGPRIVNADSASKNNKRPAKVLQTQS